ncbi:MAG: alpha-glucosidase, partial [Spirochaetota bacterium]
IANLPSGMIVEVPAKIKNGVIEGERLGELPTGIAGLLQNQVAINILAAEAALNASKERAMQALLVEPTAARVVKMEKLLDAVISLERPYLDYLK